MPISIGQSLGDKLVEKSIDDRLRALVEQTKINNAHLSILTGEHLTVDEIGEDVT